MKLTCLATALCCLILAACARDTPAEKPVAAPPPGATTITLAAQPGQVAPGGTGRLEWTSTNATSCTASGGWSGARSTAGSEDSPALASGTSFTLSCTGANPVTASTRIRVDDAATAAVFPLRVEPGKRFLVDARGAPFLIHGDTAWSIMVGATREQAVQYLDDRRSRGFNTILVNLVEHKFATHAPANAYGEAPFLTAGDFSTPNEGYFELADYIIGQAEQRGMLVLLTPAYMGYGGGDEGWYVDMKASGAAKLRGFGNYVGKRLGPHRNIVWVEGGDFDPPERELLQAVVDGIRESNPHGLHTFHGARNTAALQFAGEGSPWLSVNTIYTDKHNVVSSAFAEYQRSSMPFFLIEARYEGETETDLQARREAWTAVLSGASGQVFGNSPIWRFASGWQEALASAGSRSMSQLRGFLDGIEWWTLQPDIDGTLLTEGTGAGALRAAAALTSDRKNAVIYVPQQRSITVDLRRLDGQNIRARTFDPVSGQYTLVQGASAPGKRAFDPPAGTHAVDWVLLLDTGT